jgi:cysteine-rich repeat protein
VVWQDVDGATCALLRKWRRPSASWLKMNKPCVIDPRTISTRHRWRKSCFTGALGAAGFLGMSVLACSSTSARVRADVEKDGSKTEQTGPTSKTSQSEATNSPTFSTAELLLRTTNGVSLYDFAFEVKNALGEVLQDGSFNVPGEGTQTRLALELPVADDYDIAITGQGSLGNKTYPCSGKARFDVVVAERVGVELDIECVVPSNERPSTGTVEITATVVTIAPFVDECGIDGLVIGPLTVAPGGFITALGSAIPTTSTFAWSATEGLYGNFTDPAAGNDVLTRFRCFGGTGSLVLEVASELCTDQFSVPVSCGPAGTCGDGITQNFKGEECDDGNEVDDDGCSSACVNEVCGDMILQRAEDCDDGNLANGDGCSDDCLDEVAVGAEEMLVDAGASNTMPDASQTTRLDASTTMPDASQTTGLDASNATFRDASDGARHTVD